MPEGDAAIEAVSRELRSLSRLSKAEYDLTLKQLLDDPDANLAVERLQRLAGIQLKRSFARSEPLGDHLSKTGASRRWVWDDRWLDERSDSVEHQVLEELAEYLPTAFPWISSPDVHVLADYAEHETGLFKVLGLWLKDKIEGQESKTFKEYYFAEPGRNVGTLADLAETILMHPLTPVLGLAIPAAGVSIPIALISIRWGLDHVFNKEDSPDITQ